MSHTVMHNGHRAAVLTRKLEPGDLITASLWLWPKVVDDDGTGTTGSLIRCGTCGGDIWYELTGYHPLPATG